MNLRLQRRVAFEVRRDAATVLTNGRVLYDALFSRTGYQDYPTAGGVSVEYRPPSEVFAPASLASLANLPGVLLHPDANFGTSFGEGSYPVRGTTGSSVIEHTDSVHTAGQIMVWDAEWNGLIESSEVAELSLGYGITPGPAGTGPDGKAYDVAHTEIIGDHAAGVPEGNAGTARVVLDGRSRLATRHALAEIAAMRMDARPLHVDLGRFPRRQDKDPDTMPTPKQQPGLAKRIRTIAASTRGDAKARRDVHDALIGVFGESDDPDVLAALEMVLVPAAEEEAPAPAGEEAPAAPAAPAAAPAVTEEEEADRADALAKVEAARWVYADALELARRVHGVKFTGLGKDGRADRKDSASPLSLDALRLCVVSKVSKADGEALGRMDAKGRASVIGFVFEQSRAKLDAKSETGPKLAAEISAARTFQATASEKADAKIAELGANLKKRQDEAATANFGHPPAT